MVGKTWKTLFFLLYFLLLGGIGSDRKLKSSSEHFDNGAFRAGPDLPYESSGHCMVRLNTTHFAMLGGKGEGAMEFMLLSKDGWERIPGGIPTPR